MTTLKPRNTDERIDRIVGKNMRTSRVARNMSQSMLGDHLHVTFQQVQKYENGRNSVPTGRIRDLCKVLKISPNQLFNWGNEEMHPELLSAWATRMALSLDQLPPRLKTAVSKLVEDLIPSNQPL